LLTEDIPLALIDEENKDGKERAKSVNRVSEEQMRKSLLRDSI
jgi:hypothetical protein